MKVKCKPNFLVPESQNIFIINCVFLNTIWIQGNILPTLFLSLFPSYNWVNLKLDEFKTILTLLC